MCRKIIKSFWVGILLILSHSATAQFGTLLYSDDFANQSEDWKALSLDGTTGSIEWINGKLSIDKEVGTAFGAYYSASNFSGHFEVEVEFDQEHGAALALIKEVNGELSMQDYVMLTIGLDSLGVLEVKLIDKQRGTPNVLDNTQLIDKARYAHSLTGEEYSIPFTETANKLRILRHEREQFLHFYYAVEREIDGVVYQDWIELAPSREWGTFIDSYYIGLFSTDGKVQFDNLQLEQLPLKDQSDTATGFQLTRRPYTWSGYTDSAWVISFGKQFPFWEDDRKFVFWELANNIPVWHLNSSSLFTYGFLETWGGGNPGCHEPMSDRLLGHTEIEIVEDNDFRKVIKWSYDLINPDYKVPTDEMGDQLPEATEYYFIYADGSIIRKIQYAPKLDSDFRNWNEIMEMILIAGENQRPGNLLEYPSLTFQEINRPSIQFNTDGQSSYRNNNQRLGATTWIAHIKNAPDVFTSFSDEVATPETHAGIPLNYEVTWHDRKHNFGHWPVNKEPYALPCKSWSAWPQQIAHTSLVGMGQDLGQDWRDNFENRADGRKFREWLSLLGLNSKTGIITAEDKTNSWLFPGEVKMINDSSTFLQYSFEDKYFEFETNPENPATYFSTTPKTLLINPIIRVNNWGDQAIHVNINGKTIESSQLISYLDGEGNLFLLLPGTFVSEFKAEISTHPIPEIKPPTIDPEPSSILVYPNPVPQKSVTIRQGGEPSKVKLSISNTTGKIVGQYNFDDELYILDTSHLPAGVYVFRIEHEAETYLKKVLIL